MSAAIKIEFAGGGPADGVVRAYPDDIGPNVTIYALNADPGKWFEDPQEAGPGIVPVAIHVYRSASRLSREGNRIYVYARGERR